MFNKRKNISSKLKEGVCLYVAQKIKRCNCLFEAVDQFRSETGQRFGDINLSNKAFGFVMSRTLLRSRSRETVTNKFKNMYADGINYFKLSVEIALCNPLVQSSGTTFSTDATELNETDGQQDVVYNTRKIIMDFLFF